MIPLPRAKLKILEVSGDECRNSQPGLIPVWHLSLGSRDGEQGGNWPDDRCQRKVAGRLGAGWAVAADACRMFDGSHSGVPVRKRRLLREPSLASSSGILSTRHGGARGGLTLISSLALFASVPSAVDPWEVGGEGPAPPAANLSVLSYRMPTFPLSLVPELPRCLASGNEASLCKRPLKFVVPLFTFMVCSERYCQVLFLSSSDTKLNETRRITTTAKTQGPLFT